MEPVMPGDGDDAGHCSNGLTAQKYRESSTEERATFRAWMRGIVAFYCALLLMAGVVVAGHAKVGLTQLTNLSVHNTTTSSKAN
jgi:uncharacterized membrane protein YidH (DUF202 family)